MRPWTQRLSVSWWRSVLFFERRYEVLNKLESEGLLWGFRASEDQLALRLGDVYHVVSFRPDSLDAELLKPDSDDGRVKHAIESVIEALQPEFIVRPTFEFQWLVGVAGSYDELRAAAAAEVLPDAPGRVTDVALWLDGDFGDSSQRYFLECGIVTANEAPRRLARTLGRFEGQAPDAPPAMWPPETLPPVAFFCDSRWVRENPVSSVEHLFSEWAETLQQAEAVVSSLMNRFEFTPNE